METGEFPRQRLHAQQLRPGPIHLREEPGQFRFEIRKARLHVPQVFQTRRITEDRRKRVQRGPRPLIEEKIDFIDDLCLASVLNPE